MKAINPPMIEFTVKARLTHAPNWKRGGLFMKFADTSPKILLDGEVIGMLSGPIGGGVSPEIKVKYGTEGNSTETWHIGPLEIFNAFADARGDLSESYPEPEWEE